MLVQDRNDTTIVIGGTEVVGSNPTRSISFKLVKYGIELDYFFEEVAAANSFIPVKSTATNGSFPTTHAS
jgi:hypothetical protein